MIVFVKWFGELSKADVAIAGGKGASLGEMTRSGVPVPDGYVVLSNAFGRFFEENDVGAEIDAILDKLNHKEMESVERASEEIRALILAAPMPSEIGVEIMADFEKLGCTLVAVRSSATSEDASTAAWAGQLETYLNTTKAKLLQRVKLCWASLFTPRAIFYRFEKGLRNTRISVAVVVQEMVQSKVSGVAFSVHPVTQDRNQLVIEAAYGLGEAIVSGRVTPDTYVVRKDTREIIERHLNTQARALVMGRGGGTRWTGLNGKSRRKLSDTEILALSDLVIKIERHYGFPCDIEWAGEGRKFYITQSRPITTLTKRINVGRDTLSKIKSVAGWEYYVTRRFNWFVENAQIVASRGNLQEELFGFGLPTMNYLVLNGDEYSLETDNEWNNAFFSNRFNRDSGFFDRFSRKEFALVERIKVYENRLSGMRLDRVSDEELAGFLDEFCWFYERSFVPAFVRPDGFLESEIKKRLKETTNLSGVAVEEAFSRIATYPPLGVLQYVEEPLDLLRIASRMIVKKEMVNMLSKTTQRMLANHVSEYAWLKNPVAQDDRHFEPDDYVKRLGFLLKGDVDSRIRKIISVRDESEKDYRATISKYGISGDLLHLCEAARSFIFLRTYTTEASDHLFYLGKHKLFSEVSRRSGVSLDDLTMLSPHEIKALVLGKLSDLENLISERRKGFAIVWIDGKISTFFGKEAAGLQKEIGRMFIRHEARKDGKVVRGIAANHGKATGIVKVLHNYEDIRGVKDGDIVVASMTTPNYISAMEKASAFVTDEGGMTCHAAIVAREFGVPCVIGTVNATKVLKDGQLVEVDADNGVVRVLRGKGWKRG